MKLHLPSVLFSLGIGGLVVVLSSQGPLLPTGFRLEYMPHPRDMVQIKEGTTYTVPAGKIFVATGLGIAGDLMARAYLKFDGQYAAMAWGSSPNGLPGQSVVSLPLGLTASAGSVVTVADEFPAESTAVVWGYLASQ